jgi:hypothetical protein
LLGEGKKDALLKLAEDTAFAKTSRKPAHLLNSLSVLWDNGFREAEEPQTDIFQLAFRVQLKAYQEYYREVVSILMQEYL